MEMAKLFALVRSDDKRDLPYEFYISRYPAALAENNEAKIGGPADLSLYRASWASATAFCDRLSKENRLPPTYEAGERSDEAISADPLTRQSFRLPTPEEWDRAAHGWSGPRTGDYFAIQKKHFKIPFLDYPTTEEQRLFFENGYFKNDQLIENPIGIFGMLAYAREWCAPIDKHANGNGKIVKWEEYYANYSNDIGYRTVAFDGDGRERLPFRVVLPRAPVRP